MVFRCHRAILVALADIHQVRGVGHGFHAADDDDAGIARHDGVAAHDGGLHAGTAHLVDRGGLKALVFASLETGLTGRCLALAGGKAVAHDDFIGFAGLQLCFGDSSLHGDGAELVGAEAGEIAQQAAHRGAGHTDDNDGILFRHSGFLPVRIFLQLRTHRRPDAADVKTGALSRSRAHQHRRPQPLERVWRQGEGFCARARLGRIRPTGDGGIQA